MVEVWKKGHESIESLIRRFKKKLQRTRFLINVRRRMFYEPTKSKRQIREEAKKREELRKEREYLKKIGKIKERTQER